jgi:hypothetical protein
MLLDRVSKVMVKGSSLARAGFGLKSEAPGEGSTRKLKNRVRCVKSLGRARQRKKQRGPGAELAKKAT